jgi:diguanylate cyclase (GGDEF)-like protein
MRVLPQLIVRFAAPVVLLGAAFVAVFFGDALPPSLAGLKAYGPYIVFAVGAPLVIAFNRGRALIALVTLVVAYAAQQFWLQQGLVTPTARAVYVALAVFVPLNLALLSLLRERGTFNRHGALRLAVIALEIAIAAWVVARGRTDVVAWAWQKFSPVTFGIGALPQAGLAAIALSLIVSLAAAFVSRSAISTSCAGAIVAFAVGAHVPAASYTFSTFIAAAELMVAVAVLHDTFHMAFRDELTGLPSRRALNERLAVLPRQYAIAMVDIDHFKNFNDTWGHELGDQVLKMVAAQIADVRGGGTAYRYGGEEFTVIFPRKDAAEAAPHLEALRRNVESYQLALRASDRPRKASRSRRRPSGWKGQEAVSVTISIGVAERNQQFATPDAVIQAADRALYCAKGKGRNTLSR